MRPAAFLFDLDGTLMDTEMAWVRAIVDWLTSFGAAATVENVAPRVFGHSWPDIHATLHAAFPGLPDTTLAQDSAQLRAHYARLVSDPTAQIIPGTVAFFREAAARVPCAIVSGSPHDDVVRAAAVCGITPLVSLALGAEDYPRGKPAPDGYLLAAERLGVAPAACVVVEDSTPGVLSGLAAGMRVIGIDRNRFARPNLAGCWHVVRDLSELDVKEIFEET